MADGSSVTRVRRTYNQWVANETLEDFALRFTAHRARKWKARRVANTAIGSISFLALEAIGAALTLSYGFDNAVAAILFTGLILVLTGLPISYHAARSGVDIDLLTRGAGFGYLGSTFTSLIYASFTFIFFALEAAILALALELCFGLPLEIGYLLNALLVIPLVTHGFSRIGAFQKWTQPLWATLQIAPFVALIWYGADISTWVDHVGRLEGPEGGLDILLIAAATGVALSLIAQIGEQVDFLRFLPEPRTRRDRIGWWAALLTAGPGWAVIGTLKMLAGSYLATMVLATGASPEHAADPTRMYLYAFHELVGADMALGVTIVFVILAQLKINVTNAYAGSIAWSNFFSRITHSHPGRVVWLIFNVAIALMLMEFGVFGALEHTLSIYSHVAVAWIGAVTADLVINLPLGLRPKKIEFRRGYLYDINPVGIGAMACATLLSLLAAFGVFGDGPAAFSSLIALATSLSLTPLFAWRTGGAYYAARTPPSAAATGAATGAVTCTVCEHEFDADDMVSCPFHRGTICSLCCSLDSLCEDACKPDGRLSAQAREVAQSYLPRSMQEALFSRYGSFAVTASGFILTMGGVLILIYQGAVTSTPEAAPLIANTLGLTFGMLVIIIGVAAWLFTLSNESRRLALDEREVQTKRLMTEIRAHKRTDAELQKAKESAEAANEAKSRYLVGITHELRTPLNAILGYAQLFENDQTIPAHRRQGVKVIRRSSEHLADLIEGLLDISKIEAGRIDIYRDEIELRDLLNQISAIFRLSAQEKGLKFISDISPATPDKVIGDERRLRQILINLLSNAVRYTDEGEVRFSFVFRNETACFSISDTGRGIEPEAQSRIFIPFERIEDPDRPVPGTGLGLTITKLLVEMLGGELTLDSRVGQGSTFGVKLFLSSLEARSAAGPVRRRFGYQGARRHILIVDDNMEHRSLLSDALTPLGFTLSMAESGEAALANARAALPDLALIDVAMPGMSGWDLAALLRSEVGLTAPLIMVSAHAGDVRQSVQADTFHDAFFAKPINIEMLLDRIGEYLKVEWLYDEIVINPEQTLWAPPKTLDAIDQALSIGHLHGVKQALQGVEMADDASAAFAKRAAAFVDEIDLSGLSALVRRTRNDAS